MIYSLLDLITAAHYCHSGQLTVILQSLASLHCYRPAGTFSTEQFPTSSSPTTHNLTSFPGSSLHPAFLGVSPSLSVGLTSSGRCAAWILASVKSSIHHQFLPMPFLFYNTLPCLHLFRSLILCPLALLYPARSQQVGSSLSAWLRSEFLPIKEPAGKRHYTKKKITCRDSRHAEGNSTQEGRWGFL